MTRQVAHDFLATTIRFGQLAVFVCAVCGRAKDDAIHKQALGEQEIARGRQRGNKNEAEA